MRRILIDSGILLSYYQQQEPQHPAVVAFFDQHAARGVRRSDAGIALGATAMSGEDIGSLAAAAPQRAGIDTSTGRANHTVTLAVAVRMQQATALASRAQMFDPCEKPCSPSANDPMAP